MQLDPEYLPIVYAIGIIIITFIVSYVFNRVFRRFILKSSLILKNDPTNYQFLRHAVTAVIYTIGIGMAIFQIDSLKAVAGSLLAGAGILAVAVGFASQHALSNVISGLFIILFKPYRINDRITVKDTMSGVVEDITLRHTVIRDFQNKRIVIPNSVISNETIVNADMTDEKVCRFVEIGISYDSDFKRAKEILREEAMKHPLHIDNRTEEAIAEGKDEIVVRVVSFGDSSVNLRAWVWASDQAKGFEMHCDLLESIKERFDAEGIEIPFPYRTLVFKNSMPNN
ncbi:mechanosensitive ion channel family protein [Flavilitoribacter nigricans]|uniref:Mechanosensitive ion channel protein MscS n=1 Tax=Flavilitoribacter nigricans (strain ATCC 23147 / DSM 23189 / NBRC 102662 / NCIMB 1420 / SS-2) TaxID=1122177 RepID=A0A2D0N5T4_FLAN2|nr:mechanosensitive ion channel family protein [Flavilitoribacter nigricans]PHN03750.1 mechanosensitive ion channel protein MscS [Flavilitoribacter nigricans DSM 23189 = NBRC 102662]